MVDCGAQCVYAYVWVGRSIAEKEVLKSPIMTLELPVSFLNSVKFCFMYFAAVTRHIHIYDYEDFLRPFIMTAHHFSLLVTPFVVLCLTFAWYSFIYFLVYIFPSV